MEPETRNSLLGWHWNTHTENGGSFFMKPSTGLSEACHSGVKLSSLPGVLGHFLSLLLTHSFSRHWGIHLKQRYSCSVKNWPRSGYKRAKNMGFPPLCSGKIALSSETFAFFETTSFSGASNISVHALAVTSIEMCTRQRFKNMNG